jgi:MFS family permease
MTVRNTHTSPVPRRTLREDLGTLLRCPRELWLIYLATFFEYMGIFSFLPTVTLWLSKDFGLSDQQAGSWASIFSMLITAFVVLTGLFVERMGVRRMLLIGFTLAAVFRLGMALSTTAAMAIGTMLAFSFAYGSLSPSLQVGVSQTATKRTRPFAFSLWYVSFNIAGALSGPMIDRIRAAFVDPMAVNSAKPVLATKIMNLPFVGDRAVSAYATIMGVGFFFAVLAVLVTAFMRKDFRVHALAAQAREDAKDGVHAEVQEPSVSQRPINPFTALKEVAGDPKFWRFMALIGLLCLVKMMFQHMHFTWPKYVLREQGETFPLGTLWSVNSLLILFLAPLGTALTRERGVFETLFFGTLISSISPFILCFGSSMPFQVAAILVLTIGEAIWSPRSYEYSVSIAPKGKEALYVSLSYLPFFLAKFLVGPVSGFLLQKFCPENGPRNAPILWLLIGLSTIAGPIGMWLLRGWIQNTKPPEVSTAAALD